MQNGLLPPWKINGKMKVLLKEEGLSFRGLTLPNVNKSLKPQTLNLERGRPRLEDSTPLPFAGGGVVFRLEMEAGKPFAMAK
ncbi:hypothetical protein ACPVTF_10890 [Geobacillus icigianus]|uniref:Uncharacterized protein n=1 Tax=Geobacillus subterraneus TaxID=129338 RepID=A0A679FMW2_9BACL|nr:hypothetical protein [Geobacillus subterraneus]BBW95915.1 hypothetical protein GsuE55_07480 [Geobacillus subterraneus]